MKHNRSVRSAITALHIICSFVFLRPDSSYADFTPAHPYIYLDNDQIQVMRDNVLTHRYDWATNLYNQAKASAKTGSWNFNTYQLGKNMLGCALVYLIDGDTSYADGAVYWLEQCRLNYDPRDQTVTGSITKEKWYHFQPNQVLIPIVYDLMYNYMASNRPSDLTNLTAYIDWVGNRMTGNFDHNENHQNHFGRALCGYALGKESWINEVEDDFKSWFSGNNGDVSDGFHYEVGEQAMKHFAYVFDSQVHYALAAHNAVRKGYRTWDPVVWTNSGGFNLIRDNWRMLIKKSTPKFQVPFESMWRGNHFLTPTCNGFHHIAHTMTGNTEWQAVAAAGPARTVIPHHTVNTDWAGLAHGRPISGTPRITNDCVRNREIGFAVLNSGTPSALIDPDTALHAYLMCGDYGETPPMNLILYGKGKMLNTAVMDVVVDSWGERATGGSAVDLFIDADIAVTPTEHVWSVSNATIKIMAYEEYGQHRAVAVTKDYFADVYDVTKSGATSLTWDFQGIGPSNTALSRAEGTFPGDFTCTWPDHMKTYVINDGSSEVSLTDDSRVPYMIDGVSQRQVNPIYTTELVRKLRVRRTVTGNTRFISVVEPLGQGSVLTSVQRFNTHNTAEVTGLKIVSTNYTDYYFYANTSGTFTLTNETELVILEGKWGLIRVENGTATISGDVAAYQIPGVSGDMTQVRPPEIVPEGGTFVGGVSVSLSTIPPEASLYYTLDGSAPTTSSALYAGPFSITSSATLKVMGVANGLSDSAISSASFTIRAPVAPAAGFVLSTNFGTAPLKVTFSDTSTGDITNRFWSFGDGAETNTQSTNVMHTYTVAGTCTVTLVASGLAGVSTNIQTGAITVEPANNAGVTNLVADVNDQQRRSDGTVQVASSSTARVGTEATGVNSSLVLPFWIPDLDGLIVLDAELSVTIPSSSGLSLATGQANVDVYGVRSNPTNSLTVSTDYTDGLLLADNMFSIVSNLPIGEKTVTNAALTAWINDQIAAGGTYVFLTLRPDATASSYRYATLNTANESSGKPQLRLTLGYPAQLPLAASFTLSPASGQTPLTVSFTDTSTGSITNRFWAFGDGFTTNTSATSIGHTYTSNGVYVAQLVVSGGAGSSTNTQTVTVLNAGAPVAGFTALPVSGTAPLTVTFTDTSTGTITNRFWNFGNGVTTNTTATNVTHIYTNAGTYTVELVACGPGGVSTNRQNNLISVATPTTTVLSINGNTADQVRRSDGTAPSAASGNSRIGNDTSTSGLFCAWVVPFLLPDIGSETISAASILAFVEKTGGLPATSAVFLDLLGVRVSASNTVLSTDYQGTVVGDNLYNITSNLPLGAIEFSSAGLATWLQSIYDNDANAAGKYVFLTITPDATLPKYNYIDLTSASGTIAANRPVLRITLGSQSGTAGDADDDGLPDEWENQYFGGSTNAHPHALAANGVNTILEAYVAGLNPTNSEKFLSSVLRPPASGSILQWNAASGRVYSVYWTTNLLGGFQPLETNLVWPQNSWTDTVHSAEDGGFYRVKVQLQQ